MKNIRKRKDGRWEARKQYKKKKYYIIAKTKKECLEKFNALLKKLKKSPINDVTNISLKEWWNEWAINYKKPFISKSSYSLIEQAFKLLNKTNPKICNTNLKFLTTEEIQKTLNLIEISRKKELLCLYLNACLNMAKKLEKIKNNPFDNVIKDKKLNNVRKPFTFEEQQKILKSIKNTKIYFPIMIYLLTGIRKNELNTKNIQNDLMPDGSLKVICEKKRNNTNIYRYIELSEKTRNLILDNKIKHSTDYISKQFKKLLENLNIKGSLHTLRHTFTTNHLYLGTPQKFIQEWLGHEDLSITIKHYMGIDRTLTKEKILNLYNDYYYIIKD